MPTNGHAFLRVRLTAGSKKGRELQIVAKVLQLWSDTHE